MFIFFRFFIGYLPGSSSVSLACGAPDADSQRRPSLSDPALLRFPCSYTLARNEDGASLINSDRARLGILVLEEQKLGQLSLTTLALRSVLLRVGPSEFALPPPLASDSSLTGFAGRFALLGGLKPPWIRLVRCRPAGSVVV